MHTLSASEKHWWEKYKSHLLLVAYLPVPIPSTFQTPSPQSHIRGTWGRGYSHCLSSWGREQRRVWGQETACSKFAIRNTVSHVGTFSVCMETHPLPSNLCTLDQLQQQLPHQSGPVPQDHYCQNFSWYAALSGTNISIPQSSNDFLSLYKGFSIFTILLYGKYSEWRDMTTKQRFGQ